MEHVGHYHDVTTWVGLAVDAAGVLVIVGGALVASLRYVLGKQACVERSYHAYRQELSRAILLGLEFLIAGDIIRTVAVEPTLQSLAVLAGIVLIRTFLSITLQLEIDGHWPWQRARHNKAARDS